MVIKIKIYVYIVYVTKEKVFRLPNAFNETTNLVKYKNAGTICVIVHEGDITRREKIGCDKKNAYECSDLRARMNNE